MMNRLPIWPPSAAEKIGFEAVLNETYSFSYTPYGREYLTSIAPASSFEEVEYRLSLTREWLNFIETDTRIPLEKAGDVVEIASESKMTGGRLALRDFLVVRNNARLARLLRDCFVREAADTESPGRREIASNVWRRNALEDGS